MYEQSIQVRVRYAETDQMGYVYYGNYATYFEVGRVEVIRSMGVSYKDIEDQGVFMPVAEYSSKFIKPAKYDDLLTIKIIIKEKPGVKIIFDYEVYNEDNVLLTLASTKLVFVDIETGKPCMPPEDFRKILDRLFDE